MKCCFGLAVVGPSVDRLAFGQVYVVCLLRVFVFDYTDLPKGSLEPLHRAGSGLRPGFLLKNFPSLVRTTLTSSCLELPWRNLLEGFLDLWVGLGLIASRRRC